MSERNRLEELWEHYLQAETGTYERSSFLDVFLADVLLQLKDGKSSGDVVSFCASAGVTSIIACDMLAEVHNICSQPPVVEDIEDLAALRKFLLNGPGWRTLAVLHHLGVQTLSCGRAFASLVITIYPLCYKPDVKELPAPNPYVLGKQIHSVEDVLLKSSPNRRLSHVSFDPIVGVEFNRSLSNTSTNRMRRRRSTYICESSEGEETSASEKASDDPAKGSTLKIRLNPMDFDYFTSVVRSDDEARLESENYSPKKRVIRVKKKCANDFLDNDIRDVLSHSLSQYDLFVIMMDLLSAICASQPTAINLAFQPVCIITLNFATDFLCNLEFGTLSEEETVRLYIAERKAAMVRILIVGLEKAMTDDMATTMAVQRGVLPVMLKVLEDVVRRYPNLPTKPASEGLATYSHEFIFGLTYAVISFMYNLLLMRGNIGNVNEFIVLFDLFADSLSGRLIERSVLAVLGHANVTRELRVTRACRLIHFVGLFVDSLKKIRNELTNFDPIRARHRLRQLEVSPNTAHHHQFLFGSQYTASLTDSKSKTSPECPVASSFGMLIRLLRSLPPDDTEMVLVTIDVMSSCGTCCCFPAGIVLKMLVQVLQQGSPKTRLMCLAMLERKLYAELGAFEKSSMIMVCICYQEHTKVKFEKAQEYWSCLDHFSDMLLSPDAKLRHAITSHLLKVAPRFSIPAKWRLLFGVFYPVFLKAKARLAQEDKLDQYTVLSCLSLFTSLLWTRGFAHKFNRLHGLDEVMDLIVTPTLSELCCSILEITAITDTGSLENNEADVPNVTSVIILDKALSTATSGLLESIAVKRKCLEEETVEEKKRSWTSSIVESDFRNLSIADILRMEGCVTAEDSYLLKIVKACVFWRSCANLVVGSRRFCAYYGRELDNTSGHLLLQLVASLISAGTVFTGQRCGSLEMHLYIKLLEALLTVNVASGVMADETVAIANEGVIGEVCISLQGSSQSPHIQQICDALITSATTQGANGGKPRPAPLMVALPAQPDSLSDDEIEETYMTADEGYDADVEVLALESSEGTSSTNMRAVAYPKLATVAVELMIASRRPSVVVHGLHRLIAVAREDAANCLRLADTGLITLILEGFHEELANSNPAHDELRKVVLELVVILARNRILPDELIKCLQLFTFDDPPVDFLLDALVSLVCQCIPRPHMILAFPPDVAERPGKHSATEKRMQPGPNVDQSLPTARICCAMTLLISSELSWTLWPNGFAASFWLSASRANLDFSVPQKQSASSTSSRDGPDHDHSNGPAPATKLNSAEQLHIFSIGTTALMFEVWLDSSTLSMTFRLFRDNFVISEEVRTNILSPGTWNHLAFNVANVVVNKKNVIEARILVDGLREEVIKLEMLGILPRRAGHTELLLGSAARPGVLSTGLRSWYLGNVMLFRTPIWTRQRALYMVGLGPNYNCLAECATNDQLPNFTRIFGPSLPYGVNWEPILEGGKSIITGLQEQLLLTYSPHSYQIFNLYPLSTSQVAGPLSGYMLGAAGAATATAASEQIPVTMQPIFHAPINCRQYQGLAAAATVLGGAPLFLFLVARVVELNASETAQTNSVYLLLKLVQSDSQLHSQFIKEQCNKLLLRVFMSKQCKMGYHILAALLDTCCNKPVIAFHRGTKKFIVLGQSDAILVCPDLISTIIANWCSLRREDDDGNGVLALLFSALLGLLRDEHPFRQFNVYQLFRANIVESVVIFAKEQFLYKENVTMPLPLCTSMVELLRCLMGSPPDFAYIAALMDCVLLLHSAQATYVTHDHTNFYCLLHSKGTTKSENVSNGGNTDAEAPDAQAAVVEVQSGRHCVMEGLILLIHDALLMTPDYLSTQLMDSVIKMPILIVLTNHPDPGVRAAVILLISLYLQRSHPDFLQRFIATRGFYLVGNQLGLHDASEKVVDACMWLVTCCQVTMRDEPFSRINIANWAPQSLALLLALLPVSVRNITLAQNLTLFLRKLFIQDDPDFNEAQWVFSNHIHEVCFCFISVQTFEQMRKMLLDVGLVEVLLKTIVALCHVKQVRKEENGQCEQDLLIEEIRVFLIAIVTHAVNAPSNNKLQLLSEISLLLGFLEQRERKECIDAMRCVNALRGTQCMILEAALDLVQSKIIALEPKTNRSITNSSVLMLAASLQVKEENITGNNVKPKPLSKSELGERYNAIVVKAVEFLVSSENVAENSSVEHSFARRLFSTMLRTMCSILSSNKSAWGSVLWTARCTLRSQTSTLLVWIVSPENLIGTRLFAVTTLRGEPKLKEFMTELTKHSFQIVEKFCIFLWELINNHAEKMQSPDKRCCEDLRDQLESWNLMSSSYTNNAEIVKDLVQLMLDEMGKSRRTWHSQNSSAMLRSVSRFEEVLVSSQKCAVDVSKQVVNMQNGLRKAYMEHMKATFSENVQIRVQWAKVIKQLTHERAVWYFPHAYPNCWQLDLTEGPGRVRTRLSRSHMTLEKRYLMDDHPHTLNTDFQPDQQPLSYLFALDPDSSASSVLIERLHNNEKVQYMSPACVVTPARELPGELLVGEACLYFVADNSELALSTPDLDTAWHFRDIKEVLRRRFQLKERAVEIFLTNGTTNLVAFQSSKERDGFLGALVDCELPNLVVADHLDDAKQLWREGLLTNWEYVTQLNKIAGRSYNDLMQYPVFPFVLAEYVGATLDLSQPNIYRNFKKPMAVQDKKNEQHYINNYNYFKQELMEGNQLLSVHSEPYHYGSHYSNSGTVLHFLVRLPPFTSMFLTYQDNNFDLPDRTFHSIHTTWRLASSDSTTDVKELIPEFFYLPEFLQNTEHLDFGVRQNGNRVDNVELPPWCGQDARLFVLIHRQALEAGHVRENLPHWLDLIFGFKQTGKPAIDAINVFHPATYCAFQVDNIVDPLERSAWETMVKTYGQTPRQLLHVPHPMVVQALAPHTSKSAIREVLPNVKGLVWGSYVGSPADLEPATATAWNSNHHTPITAFESLPTNEVLGLALCSSLLVSFVRDKGVGYMNQPILQGVALITWGHADFVLRIKIKKDQIPVPIIRVNALDPVSICATTPECNQLWMGHTSGKIVVYRCNMELGKSLVEFAPDSTTLWAHTACVTTLRLCLPFSIAVSGSADNTLIIWDLNKVQYVRTITMSCPPSVLTISPTLGDIAVSCNSTLQCYTVNARVVGSVTLKECITALCYSTAPEGISVNVIAAGLASGLVRLWSSWDLSVVRDLSTTYITKPIACIAYSADGQYLYTSAFDGSMVVWERPGAKAANRTPKFSNLTFL